MRICIRCNKGKCRLNKTLCDRCLRDYLKRQRERDELQDQGRAAPRGVTSTWKPQQWDEHFARMIDYLEELERCDTYSPGTATETTDG